MARESYELCLRNNQRKVPVRKKGEKNFREIKAYCTKSWCFYSVLTLIALSIVQKIRKNVKEGCSQKDVSKITVKRDLQNLIVFGILIVFSVGNT